MSNIEKIKAEIERLKNENAEWRERINSEDGYSYESDVCCGYDEAIEDFETFINSLPEEKPSENLEEAVEKQINDALFKWSYDDEDGIEQYVHDAFITGAKWQAEHLKNKTMTREDIKHIVHAIKNYRQVNVSWFIKDDDFIAEQLETRFIDKPDLIITTSNASEGLDEAAYKYSFESRPSVYGQVDVIDAFKAGAEWQKQRDAELIEIAYNDGITIGKTKQKEQMIKDSEEDALLLERA